MLSIPLRRRDYQTNKEEALPKEKLGWKPKVTFEKLVKMMIEADLEEAKRDLFCKENGFKVNEYNE